MNIDNPLLVFDLGNVIIRHDNDLRDERLFAACADPAAARRVMMEAGDGGKDTGAATVEQFFHGIRDRLGFSGDYTRFAELWGCHFSHDEAMEELVEALAAKYRLVILSNTDDAHWKHLIEAYPILGAPHALYTSFEMKMHKPDEAIYREVLRLEGRDAQHAVFIDDRIENVEAARAIGMYAIHFIDRLRLEESLANLGIKG